MVTAFFWISWGLISFWALKTFYYSFSARKLENLRKSALGINAAVLILTFLPWLPSSLGEKSAFTIATEGNGFAVLFLLLLIVPIILLLTKTSSNLKLASSATIINTLMLLAFMMNIRPGTFTLTLFDIAPIVAILFLLVGDVIGLLLWQQLQIKERK